MPRPSSPLARAVVVSTLIATLVATTACTPRASTQPDGVAATPTDVAAPTRTEAARAPMRPDYRGETIGRDARRLVDWVVARGDHGGRAFAVVDKTATRVHVFDAAGRLVGSASVLLGEAIGDDTVPGIGTKTIAEIRPEERTTPAGRFVTRPGTNADGKPVVWVDYDAAVSMHVVINETPSERRLERIVSPLPARHRISWGCINLPAAFFADVLQPAFAAPGGVVYILPEVRALDATFPGLRDNDGAEPAPVLARLRSARPTDAGRTQSE